MEFKFFKDALNFAYLVDNPQPCSICGNIGIWFNTGGYVGVQRIACICENCLKSGSLIELEIEANQVERDDSDDAITLIYKTPALPTWQDISWPMIDGTFPVFEKIASKLDFESKESFLSSYIGTDHLESDFAWLWDVLPEKPLSGYKEAGDVSVYLFESEGKKFWISDAN